jgi:2-octaprenylphenol hydroxylase
MSEPAISDLAQYDILVVGGGINGLACACALEPSGLRIGVVDQREPEPFDEDYALRVSAINRASLKLFNSVGVFEDMRAMRVSPFRQMHVWDSSGVGQIHFDSAELGLDTLGYIIENNVIQLALLEKVSKSAAIDWICPAEIETIHADETLKQVVLSDGRILQARLVVGADGAQSRVRELMGIEMHRTSYQQKAIVCTVETEYEHEATAWQCFMPSGPLAFLPLADGSSSIVWSLDEDRVEDMLALDDDSFARELEQAFEYRLGAISSVSARAAFPLSHAHVDQYVQPGMALIGDAAHNIHPLAGQGANLGIMDAACLADVVIQALRADRQWFALHTLRKYERARKGDNRLMESSMTGFKTLFGNTNPVLVGLRNTGLLLADRITPIKDQFMRHAMGLN